MAKKKAPAKKKGDSYIAKAPIRRLMKKEGVDSVAADAVDKLMEFLEKFASEAASDVLFKKRAKGKSIKNNF